MTLLLLNILETFPRPFCQYKHLFRSLPGSTTIVYHHIPTHGSPVHVPPRRIPAHYRDTGETNSTNTGTRDYRGKLQSLDGTCCIVPKKSGGIHPCIDYRELNKRTVKDAYPTLLVDEVQDHLSGCSIFTTLDLQSGYWQLPVHPADVQKPAFCPNPGMGLYQFKQMLFGLTEAPGSFQRLMDKIMRGLPFITTYIDDVLVHSKIQEQHKQHLQQVFQCLSDAGLTLRGHKCTLAMSQVTYLGHKFTQSDLTSDGNKIQAIQEWPIPTNVSFLKQFFGLASYYRRYITHLKHKGVVLASQSSVNHPFSY